MAKVFLLLFGIIVIQKWSKAAATENSHPVITTSIEDDITLENEPETAIKHTIIDSDSSQSQRQKRFYDYMGYPPYDYPAYPYTSQPHYSKRDDSRNTGVYGTEDALGHIFTRLHEVVKDVRQQSAPRPPQTPIPIYIPFLYIPQVDCGCSSNTQGPAPPVTNPTYKPSTVSNPTSKPPTVSNPTKPPATGGSNTVTQTGLVIGDRFPELDDKRRNWGIVVNKTGLNDVDDDDDGIRPINLNPVPTEEPIRVPVPPVDHGTVQAGAAPPRIPVRVTTRRPVQDFPGYPPAANSVPQLYDDPQEVVLSLCDGAILKCCYQPQGRDKCFELEGCENPYIYGTPCDPKVQSMVVTKFLNFQKRRTG